MIRTLRLAVAAGLLATLVVGTGPASAQQGGRHKVLDEPLIGLATPLTVVAGVTGAGHAWSIEEGYIERAHRSSAAVGSSSG